MKKQGVTYKHAPGDLSEKVRQHPGPTGVCSVTGDRLWPSAPPDNPTPPSVEEDALPTPMISVSAAAEGTRASAAIVASSDKILRAAGISAIFAVGVDCWAAGLLDCCPVTLCCCAAFLLSWVLACAVRWVSKELSLCFLGSILQIDSQFVP